MRILFVGGDIERKRGYDLAVCRNPAFDRGAGLRRAVGQASLTLARAEPDAFANARSIIRLMRELARLEATEGARA